MHIAHAHALFVHIFCQVFGHAFGQRGDQHAVAIGGDATDFIQQIIDLHFDRADFNLGVQQASRADDLFGEYAARLFQLPALGRGGHENRLRPHRVPFLELQRPVVHAGRQTEPVFGQGKLAPVVTAIHAADLRHRDVAFIGKDDGAVGDEFKQGRGRLTRRAAGQITRVVFDAVANPRGFQHFQIEIRPLFQALGLKQFALIDQLCEP